MEGDGTSSIHLLVYCEKPNQAERYCNLLDLTGLNSQIVESPEAFWVFLAKQPVDLVLLCTTYPDPPAFQICQKLKAPASPYQTLPVIVVFPESTPPEVMIQALHLGAYDYLAEPFNEIALLTKVTVLARIKQAEEEFREMAITDIITGLYDHRYLSLRAQEELSRAVRYGSPISFLSVSIGALDKIESQYGPGSSNSVVQLAADCIRVLKRQIDVLARDVTGQFALVLYNTDETGTLVFANRLLLRLQQHDYGLAGFKPEINIGASSFDGSAEQRLTASELMQQAYDAMLKSKDNGDSGIVIYRADDSN